MQLIYMTEYRCYNNNITAVQLIDSLSFNEFLTKCKSYICRLPGVTN